MPCKCSNPSTPVGELLKCKMHFEGHMIIECQVCKSSVCRLFFPEAGVVESTNEALSGQKTS